jgi:hypothetical protein
MIDMVKRLVNDAVRADTRPTNPKLARFAPASLRREFPKEQWAKWSIPLQVC